MRTRAARSRALTPPACARRSAFRCVCTEAVSGTFAGHVMVRAAAASRVPASRAPVRAGLGPLVQQHPQGDHTSRRLVRASRSRVSSSPYCCAATGLCWSRRWRPSPRWSACWRPRSTWSSAATQSCARPRSHSCTSSTWSVRVVDRRARPRAHWPCEQGGLCGAAAAFLLVRPPSAETCVPFAWLLAFGAAAAAAALSAPLSLVADARSDTACAQRSRSPSAVCG